MTPEEKERKSMEKNEIDPAKTMNPQITQRHRDDGMCECLGWCCADVNLIINGNGHHPNCQHYRRPIQPATNPAIKESVTTDGPSPASGTRAQWESEADGHKPIRPAPGSDTPRTDERERQNSRPYNIVKSSGWSFARTIERELTALKSRIANVMSDYETAELRCKRVEERNAALVEEVRVLSEAMEKLRGAAIQSKGWGYSGSVGASSILEITDKALKQSRERLEKI